MLPTEFNTDKKERWSYPRNVDHLLNFKNIFHKTIDKEALNEILQKYDTFEFLVDYITSKVVEWIIRDQEISLEEALLMFHNSETFEKLCERKTEMYIESPAFIYEIFQEELRRGTIRGLTE